MFGLGLLLLLLVIVLLGPQCSPDRAETDRMPFQLLLLRVCGMFPTCPHQLYLARAPRQSFARHIFRVTHREVPT